MAANTSPPTLLRLSGLSTSDLPPTSQPEAITTFLTTLLKEAIPFISSIPSTNPSSPQPPPSPWKQKSPVTHPSSTSPINLFTRPLGPDIWACRRSVHKDEASPRTASWAEFVQGIKTHHAEFEKEYTPSIIAHQTRKTWDIEHLPAIEVDGKKWGAFTLRVEEARHTVGRPVLRDRVFRVVQMAASVMHGEEEGEGEGEGEWGEFVVVSVPVTDSEGWDKDGTVEGAYVSVERVRREDGGEIEWVMATASDAKGNLPMWVQSRAVPGQIAKDVGLFLGWMARRREVEG